MAIFRGHLAHCFRPTGWSSEVMWPPWQRSHDSCHEPRPGVWAPPHLRWTTAVVWSSSRRSHDLGGLASPVGPMKRAKYRLWKVTKIFILTCCVLQLMKATSSTDTPLGTVTLLTEKQKAEKTPYVVLSGAGAKTSGLWVPCCCIILSRY